MRTMLQNRWAVPALVVWSFIGAIPGCAKASPPVDLPLDAVTNRTEVNQGSPVDWPRWRGAELNGISPEGGWETKWPDDGPTKLWNTNVGIGFSSMAAVGERLFTMGYQPLDAAEDAKVEEEHPNRDDTSEDEGNREKEAPKRGIDTVYCLDAQTGEVIWTHRYACRLVDNLHEGGPAATPTIDDDRVFTVSKEGHFFCLDSETGGVVWSRKFVDDLGVKMPGWGFSCSPLVDGELVIVDGGRVAAYKRSTGELVWKTDQFRPGYGSAVAFDYVTGNGETQRMVSVLNNDCLLVLKIENGQEFSRFDWTTAYQTSASTPTIVGDTVFVSTGYRRGCLLAKITAGELTKVYENKDMCNHMNNCVLWDGCWYGFDGNSHNRRNVTLSCLDFATGELNWKERGLGCGSLMIAGGKLICLGDRGEMAIIEPSSKEYREISRFKVIDGKCWTVPVLARGRVFIRNAAGDLVCLDMKRRG